MILWGCDEGGVKNSSSCSTICIRGEEHVCAGTSCTCANEDATNLHLTWRVLCVCNKSNRRCCTKKLHPLWSRGAGYLITHYRLGFDLLPALWRALSSYISYRCIYFMFLSYNCALCNTACMKCLAHSKIFLHEQKKTKNSPITSVKYYVKIRLKNRKLTS